MTDEMRQFLKELGELCAKHNVTIKENDTTYSYSTDYSMEAYMEAQFDNDNNMIRKSCVYILPDCVGHDIATYVS